MRVFLVPLVAKLAQKERIPNASFCKVAGEVVRGEIRDGEADLGSGLFKKRVGRNNQGKREGMRMIVGYKDPRIDRVLFAYAFPKSAASTLTPAGQNALTKTAKSFIGATNEQLANLLRGGEVKEVNCDGGTV